MKTLNSSYTIEYRKLNKLLLTGCLLTGVLTGWLLGSLNAQTAEKGNNTESISNGMTLSSLQIKGEKLPTVILNEFSVIADQRIKR